MKQLQHHRVRSIEKAPLILLGAGLNQTAVIAGVNLSAADLVLPLTFLILIACGNFRAPAWIVALFAAFSAALLINSAFLTPAVVSFNADPLSIISDYAKLAICVLYLILAFNLALYDRLRLVIRSFYSVATVVGSISVLNSLVPSFPVPNSLYFESSTRFRGLMNDPNYFSVTQLAALALLVGDQKLPKHIKVPSAFILIGSSLLTGSKTGLLTLAALLTWWLAIWVFRSSEERRLSPLRLSVGVLLGVALTTLYVIFFNDENRERLAGFVGTIPALSRFAPLILNFNEGIQAGGSSRTNAWEVAAEVIGVSPITGIGVGTYLDVSELVTGERVLAHNSFLQLAAEWGILATLLFFGSLLCLVFSVGFKLPHLPPVLALRSALVVMLVGSLGVSLNNSRLFWILVGSLLAFSFASKRLSEPQRIVMHAPAGRALANSERRIIKPKP